MWEKIRKVNRFLKALSAAYERFEEVFNAVDTPISDNNNNNEKDTNKRTKKQ